MIPHRDRVFFLQVDGDLTPEEDDVGGTFILSPSSSGDGLFTGVLKFVSTSLACSEPPRDARIVCTIGESFGAGPKLRFALTFETKGLLPKGNTIALSKTSGKATLILFLGRAPPECIETLQIGVIAYVPPGVLQEDGVE